MLFSQQAGKTPLPAAAPLPWYSGLNSRTPLPQTVPDDEAALAALEFFSPAQMRTLIRLSKVLMPPLNGKPGAIEAGTPEFLDFLLSDSAPEKQKTYTSGLDWLEAEAKKNHKQSFSELNDEQIGALIKPWLRTWMNDHPPTEPHADFINLAHDEIREATFNSKAWGGGTGMYWSQVEPDPVWLEAQPHVAAERSKKSMPMYQR